MRTRLIDKIQRQIDKGQNVNELAKEIGLTQPALWNLLHNNRYGNGKTFELIQNWKPKRKG